MDPNASLQTLRERILDAHLHIRAADIGQYIAAFLPTPKGGNERKAARQHILPALKSLVQAEQVECHATVRPFISANDIALADRPFLQWVPGDREPPLSMFTLHGHFWLDDYFPPTGKPLNRFHTTRFTRQIGSPNVRIRYINYPWVNIYTTSASAIRTLYGRESPTPDYLKFPQTHYTPLDFGMAQAPVPTDDPLLQAEVHVDHQLMVTSIYFHLRKRSSKSASLWTPLGVLDAPQNLGRIPDALVAQDDDGPALGIGYAGPLTDVKAIHRFCRDRDMPYELWGHRRTEAWYNPCCHTARILAVRNKVLSDFGPLKCAPALVGGTAHSPERE